VAARGGSGPMTSIRVAVPSILRSYTNGATHVTVAVAGTAPLLGDVLAALDAMYPGIRFRMLDERGNVRPHIQIFVNANVERDPCSRIPVNGEVMIVGALSGG
jgi:molybdopterin synthase sulfur carrier subunit